MGMYIVTDRLKERAFIHCVDAPARPGQYKKLEDSPSILMQPLQCCFTPNFHMFFLGLSRHCWVPTTRIVSCVIPGGRDPPTLMCKMALG